MGTFCTATDFSASSTQILYSHFVFHSVELYLQNGYIVTQPLTNRADPVSKREELVAHRLFGVHPLGSLQILQRSG